MNRNNALEKSLYGASKDPVLVMLYCKLSVETLETIIAFPFIRSLLASLARREERAPSGDSFSFKRIAERPSTRSHRGVNGYGWFHNIQYPKGDHNVGMTRGL